MNIFFFLFRPTSKRWWPKINLNQFRVEISSIESSLPDGVKLLLRKPEKVKIKLFFKWPLFFFIMLSWILQCHYNYLSVNNLGNNINRNKHPLSNLTTYWCKKLRLLTWINMLVELHIFKERLLISKCSLIYFWKQFIHKTNVSG
jgi:hypothetical protein